MAVDELTANYRQHKQAVNRLVRQGAPADAILTACDNAVASFEAYGWPDNWAYFQRVANDASFGARYY